MSFNIGLSGLNAASEEINVTGNNIVNASTVGFKKSRTEFVDVFAASVLGGGSTQQGSGVSLQNIAQDCFSLIGPPMWRLCSDASAAA